MPWPTRPQPKSAASRADRAEGGGFSPVGDDLDIPAGIFFDPADNSIPNIPMLLCSVKHEGNPDRNNPELEDITLDGVVEKMTPAYGEHAREAVEAYAKNFPECRPIEIWALLTGVRTNIVRSANTKYQQGAPVYVAWFGWQPPLFDKMSDALVAFMRTGDPNCKSLPAWPKYTPENGEVMVLDDKCVVMNDPDRPARQVIENLQR